MLRRALVTALLALTVSTPSPGEDLDDTFRFESEASTSGGVGHELLGLYSGLAQRNLLRLRPYENVEGLRVEEIMRRERLWFTPGFPEELDQLLCRLNAAICRLEPSTSQRFDRTYPTTWHLRAGDTVMVPDIQLVVYLAPRAYRKLPGEDLESIVVRKTLGCDELDDWCKQYIRALNHRADDVLNPAYSGTVVVPSLAIRGEIPIAPRPAPTLEIHSLQAPVALPAGASSAGGDERARQVLEKDPELRHLLAPRVRVEMNSSHDPLEIRQRPLFELIHHPFAKGQPIPGSAPMTVAVIDDWVDEQHCDFDTTFTFGNRKHLDVPRADCGAVKIDDPPVHSLDHGTHVVGIIAARDDTNGIVGVYPTATVVTFEADYQKAIYASEVSQFIHSPEIDPAKPPPRIDVFNISATYVPDQLPGGVDPIARRLQQFEDVKLVVAAAGNGEPGSDMSTGCRVFPACFESRNLLSVVALNGKLDDPDILSKDGAPISNYGTKFHVGAPGEAILSTIHGNRWGHMSGTSQATPVVAAAAAILWSTDVHLRPAHVKERLIATADLPPNLRDKVLGGRINLERALDHKRDHLALSQNGIESALTGTLDHDEVVTDAAAPTARQMLYWNDASGQRHEIQLRHVLRLRRDDPSQPSGTWMLLVRDHATPSDQRDATPIRHDGIRVLPTSSKPLRIDTGDSVVQFQAPQVVDLVARLTQGFWHPE